MSGVSQGSAVTTLFNIFMNNMDSVIECTLSKFADDIKMSGKYHTPEGEDAIQSDLGRLEDCACANLMEFNKTMGKDQDLSHPLV
ncbi:hypothetical protein DUI87_05093 [Hirundo rustica rustica]|uniref:Reverse transcriptase domain-containing protein n=1 Tax=Hirundo rustica rustica TaxID=333673 RepID=A0A3M0KY37_HIRRU|nr:hypothetical protein DUI87_05093 [Hirundo rustica rustica]